MFSINDNKTVKIKSNSTTYSGEDNWRKNIKRILEEQSKDNGDNTLFSNLGNNLTVSDKVDLLMEADPPTLSFGKEGEADRPIKNFLEGGHTGNSLLDSFSGAATKGLNIAASAYNIAQGLKSGINGPGTSDTFFPWYINVPAWSADSVTGQNFDYTFNFKLGQYGLWNAREEVVLPILNLMAPAMPRCLSSLSVQGPFPTTLQLLGNIIFDFLETLKENGASGLASGLAEAGANVLENIKSNFENAGGGLKGAALGLIEGASSGLQDLASFIGGILTESYVTFTYDVSFGNITTYRQCLITYARAEYSKETDENGYPVSGSIRLRFHSMVPAAMVTKDGIPQAIRFGVE